MSQLERKPTSKLRSWISAEDTITEEETAVKVASTEYEHFMLAQEQARINLLVDNRVSNISTSPRCQPERFAIKSKFTKPRLACWDFSFSSPFGLPFFIEMVLDQSLKSPMDVQARIPMPLFINIPRTNGHSKLPQLKPSKQVPLLNGANGENGSTPSVGAIEQSLPAVLNGNGNGNGHVAAWDERHELRPFFETLRDRLMTYFEMINLTHKPKLVAVTSCGPGAGVTTTAAGLASSLSEIGDGNVLLVSMNERNGEAQRFYKGKLTCGIEEVLQKDNRNHAQVQSNLFVAQEGNGDDRLPRVLPKRFSHLVPLLKASDYDYIIFDMPPVSEISVTPRLARFMDMVLLVIESEKTSRDVASRVASQLAESKTNVGMVLNKNRSYMPKRLEQSM
jgi:Mrp family chromosome partitioning ATPase